MTLEEAIEILDLEDKGDYFHGYTALNTAVKLGIEALKFFKDLKDRGALPADVRLPGETKE